MNLVPEVLAFVSQTVQTHIKTFSVCLTGEKNICSVLDKL